MALVGHRLPGGRAGDAIAIATLACAGAIVAAVLAAVHETSAAARAGHALVSLSVILPAILGVRLAQLVPANAVGRRLAWLGLAMSWMWLNDAVLLAGNDQPDATAAWLRWGALFDSTSFMVVFLALIALVWVFPDGRAPTAAWGRRGHVVGWAFVVLIVFSTTLGTDLAQGPDGRPIASPLPDPGPWLQAIGALTVLGLLFALFAAAWSIRWRLKHATGIERLQLSWLAYAAVLLPASLVACLIEGLLLGSSIVVTAAFIVATPLAISAAVAIAVLRHRLYAIDRLINRTLVYAALTGALALAYAAVVLVVGGGLGGGTRWTTAAATLAVALAFRPARDAAQRAVDHRFDRRRFEGLRAVEAFQADVRAGRDEPERIGEVLARALGDRGLEVLYWLPASCRYAGPGGRLTDLPGPADPRARTPVRRGDLELGLVLHSPRLAERADTLETVLRAAGLAMEIARLRVEVRVQLAEVEASRARILSTAEAERRRLERDLHDGAQQRLVSLGLAVRHAQHVLDEAPGQARSALDDAIAEVSAALVELRELARGLRPALLDAGLAPALADVASRSPVPVEVRIRADGLSLPVEAAAYYVACEAMTNAVKHAGARRVWVHSARSRETLWLEVGDDGVGGATSTPGGGLAGLADRVAAHGGTLTLSSPVGGGTTLRAELPCAS